MRPLYKGDPHLPEQLNIERFYHADPVNAGEAKLRVKAASSLSVHGRQMDSIKLLRTSGSFDFHSGPHVSDMPIQTFHGDDTSGHKEIP